MAIKLEDYPLDEMRRDLAVFEDRYGVPSADLLTAFMSNGHLEETEDFFEWSDLYASYRLTIDHPEGHTRAQHV